jgi:glycosyltransferase involved in cell wall biosynthesis
MRIAIVSAGRFWVCDLARELDARGHDVAFYSLVPPWRTRRFGLPTHCERWLGPVLAPVWATRRALARTPWAAAADHLLAAAIDAVVARRIERCDVLIGMSQFSQATMRSVRRRFGARAVLERGSRHILSQREILAALPSGKRAQPRVPDWAVARELAEYQLADMIVVPSKHAETSFAERGVSSAKLFCNPYGVDLGMFPPTLAPAAETPPTIIMAGTWCLRKGVDVLVDAWRRLAMAGSRLLHVGHVGDASLPRDPGFVHHPLVDQRQLSHWYAQAHVMALASREEGLALVQPQALASGLHLAATEYTGAADLQECLEDPSAVAVVPPNDAPSLAAALGAQLARARALTGVRDLLRSGRDHLTWEAYGKRYDAMLRRA